MAGQEDSLFTNQTASLLVPGTSRYIQDQRGQIPDYAAMMKHAPPAFDPQFSSPAYPPTVLGVDQSTLPQVGSAPPHPGYGFGASLPKTMPSALPSIGYAPPMSPGDPGWTPPPSVSGPHNPEGDPPVCLAGLAVR